MNDLSDLVPIIAAKLGLAPGTFLLFLLIVHRLAVIGNRRIPNDATGFWGFMRQTCAIFAMDPSSQVTSGVTVQDIAKQSLTTPPVPQKVAAEKGVPVSDILPDTPKVG